MSIDIYGKKKSELNYSSEEDLYYPVATLENYKKYWLPCIKEKKIRYFRDCSVFTADQIDLAIADLNILLQWCNDKVEGGYKIIMRDKIINILCILSEIPKEEFKEFSIG